VNGIRVRKILFWDKNKKKLPKTEKAFKIQCGSDYAWAAFLEGASKQRFAQIKGNKNHFVMKTCLPCSHRTGHCGYWCHLLGNISLTILIS
jgi:hypothetical protein